MFELTSLRWSQREVILLTLVLLTWAELNWEHIMFADFFYF